MENFNDKCSIWTPANPTKDYFLQYIKPFVQKKKQKQTFKASNKAIFQQQSDAFFRYKVNYPELIAKSCKIGHETKKIIKKRQYHGHTKPPCVNSYIRLKCGTGHIISKSIYCGREWCRTCGEKKSVVHQRRQARWTPKAKQIETMAYLVLTIPPEIRSLFNSKLALQEFRTFVRRYIKREKLTGEYARGFMRWHFAGDCKVCRGLPSKINDCSSCEATGADRIFHPHLNILLSGGWIKPEKILKFRTAVEFYMKRISGKTVEGIVNVRYSNKENQKKHWIAYVTRATWRFYDKKICAIINAFRNCTTFGKFEKPEIETAQEATEFNCCPVCLAKDGIVDKLKKLDIRTAEKFVYLYQNEVAPGIFWQTVTPKLE